MRKGKRLSFGGLKVAGFVILCAAVLFMFSSALTNLNQGRRDEGHKQLEDALRRAAIACYAAEGVYPPTLEYLQAHYGVQIDAQNYAVFYSVFADNLMPEIVVLNREYEEIFGS